MFCDLIFSHQIYVLEAKQFTKANNTWIYKGKLISAFMPLYELYPSQIDDNVRNLKSIVGKIFLWD